MVAIIIIATIMLLVIALISQKLALEACVAWMEENNYNEPTKRNKGRREKRWIKQKN